VNLYSRALSASEVQALYAAGLGFGVVAPSITTQPVSQTVTASQTANFSVAATGTTLLSYQWYENATAIVGATSSSYTTPATSATDNGAPFSVTVSNAAGNVTSNNATLTVNAAPVPPAITTQPVSQTVIAGQTATFSVAASGTAPLSYQWKKNATIITGAISASYTTPATSAADNGAPFSVTVSNAAGNVTSNNATLTVNAAVYSLIANPSSLAFGNINVGSSSTLPVTLSNSGNANVTVSNVSISGAGFNASGISSGQLLLPGQNATLNVSFAPAGTGSVAGSSATVTSNATNSPMTITLSGTGIQAHSATLSWTASTSSVVGYNTYRGLVKGGPYTKLTTTPVAMSNYMDSTVLSGVTYYYTVTSVASGNNESGFSNEVIATIP